MHYTQESLEYKQPIARDKNKRGLEWLNKSFEKIFWKLKHFDNFSMNTERLISKWRGSKELIFNDPWSIWVPLLIP